MSTETPWRQGEREDCPFDSGEADAMLVHVTKLDCPFERESHLSPGRDRSSPWRVPGFIDWIS